MSKANEIAKDLKRLGKWAAESITALNDACYLALDHVVELEEAWQRGAVSSCDGKDAERSNRNVQVRNALYAAIESARNGFIDIDKQRKAEESKS